jgi:putative endonuclease
MKEEKFFVYILQSMKDFSFYVGQCDDLDWRVSKHNEGMSKYTASKRPWRLVYFEMYATRSEALKRERQIKKMKSKIYLENLISNWSVARVVE